MAKNQKSYTPEFKQQIVKQLSPIKGSEEETATLKEYKALQMENQRLKIENEILKKATAIFAKEQ